jgi:maltooligosyltrehalose trehalohydrolase
MKSGIPRPDDPLTFSRSVLDHAERDKHGCDYALHYDLLHLRREDPVFRSQQPGGVDGAVLGPQSFALRFFGQNNNDRLVIVNLGQDFQLYPAPEPLLAPPRNSTGWQILWSSENPRYGGMGTPSLDLEAVWKIYGRSTVVLEPIIS